ncbi:MAG: helix-turn-helix domain-containing protein [Novosphingobium sp.]|nr:helix-turn-helix domain-containing protein [Novosphingobium sp.]
MMISRDAELPYALERKLLERTLEELDRTRKWMALLSRKSAKEKVAIFLLDMAQRLPNLNTGSVREGAQPKLELPFGRPVIADVLGLSTETVCRQLTALKREGILEFPTRRSIRIAQWNMLESVTRAE